MSVSTAKLEFCSEPVDLHCPVCGQIIFHRGVLEHCCEHVIFVADSASGNWSWQQQQFTVNFDRAIEEKYSLAVLNGFYDSKSDYIEGLKADTVATLAAATISRKSAILLSIATSDIGCGGTFNGTIYAIFDFLVQKQVITTFQQQQ